MKLNILENLLKLYKLNDFQFKMRFSNCHLLEEKENPKVLGINKSQRLAPKNIVQLHCVIACIHHREYWIRQEFGLLTSRRNCYRKVNGALNYSMLNSWWVLIHNTIYTSHWLASSTHSTHLYKKIKKTVSKLTVKRCIFFPKTISIHFYMLLNFTNHLIIYCLLKQ